MGQSISNPWCGVVSMVSRGLTGVISNIMVLFGWRLVQGPGTNMLGS